MNSTEIFDQILKSQMPPRGVYVAHIGDPNYEICGWIHTSISTFLSNNANVLSLEAPHFDFINSDGINACASQPPYNFIGVTKGLVDYSSFLFRNFLCDNDFLNKELDDSKDKALILKYVQFESWITFRNENGIIDNPLDYSPSNVKRKQIAEALFDYYVFFVVMHEIGHLNQGQRHYTFEFQNENDCTDNLESQILEMDADKFAVNKLAKEIIKIYTDRNLQSNEPYFILFGNKKTLLRCFIFILLFMFFMFSISNKFQKYILEFSYPHPSLRAHYCIVLLLKALVNNSFLTADEVQVFGRQSVFDFGNLMKRIFPNAGLKNYFALMQDKDLQMHHETLQNAAKPMKNLNGYGIP